MKIQLNHSGNHVENDQNEGIPKVDHACHVWWMQQLPRRTWSESLCRKLRLHLRNSWSCESEPLQLWSEDRHRHRQATNMYINIYIYTYLQYMYIHRYDVEHCETCFCFSALLAMMSFISLWRGSHMSATGMPAWWWTSVRHQWLSSYFMESSVGVLGGSWRDMMQQKSVPWLRTKRT